MQRRQPHHTCLETPMNHNLPSRQVENKEVIHRLKREVNLMTPIKPKVPSRINGFTTTFENTLDVLSPQTDQELSSKITSKDYLAATFKWSHIINQCIKSAT